MNKWVFLFLLLPQTTSEYAAKYFVVWDVGQGSWATVILPKQCIHFDMGGEYFHHSVALRKWCLHKKNTLALSHLDKDHIHFIKKTSRGLDICLLDKGQFPKHPSLQLLPECLPTSHIQQIYSSRFLLKNESHIYLWNNLILAPGDAYKKQEQLLRKNLPARLLLVGHHGSRTSTSEDWIRRMPHLQQAIVSARKNKYRHPHVNTRKTLKKYYVPLIETNDFGSLIYEL